MILMPSRTRIRLRSITQSVKTFSIVPGRNAEWLGVIPVGSVDLLVFAIWDRFYGFDPGNGMIKADFVFWSNEARLW